jgi:hypothetical protein
MREFSDYTRLKNMEKKENITEYARRMRELAGFAEGNQSKSLKTIQEGASSFEDGAIFMAKDMMVSNKTKKAPGDLDINGNPIPTNLPGIKENFDSEEFTPHGSYTVSNSGGYEIMLSNSGDAAKVRDAYGSDNPKTSDWLEIEYVTDEEGESNPVIDPNGYNIPLNQVMRINENKTQKEDFETHKFEQKTIEEGADDEELYSLNENTIIVLDFLKED